MLLPASFEVPYHTMNNQTHAHSRGAADALYNYTHTMNNHTHAHSRVGADAFHNHTHTMNNHTHAVYNNIQS